MPQLTPETIHLIDEWHRYNDLAVQAHSVRQLDHEVEFSLKSLEMRGRVTEEQIAAYHAAGIMPPHVIGQDAHDATVNAYFAQTAGSEP